MNDGRRNGHANFEDMIMIKVANAPCSWGVLEFDLEGEAAGYEQVLDEIKETGYQGTELGDWGFMPTDPAVLRNELVQRDLHLLGAFVPVAFADGSTHDQGMETALRTARLMADAGFSDAIIVLADDNGKNALRTARAGRIKPEEGLRNDEWTVFADGVQKIANGIREKTGLRTVFHHHCAGYVETPEEVDALMKRTDPGLLGLCLDMGHFRFGGGDPLKALQMYGDRVWHIHFKDCEPRIAAESRQKEWDYFESVRNGVFCPLGKGEVDFKSIVEELKTLQYSGWIVVEQDVLPGMGNPKNCARDNRLFINGLGI